MIHNNPRMMKVVDRLSQESYEKFILIIELYYLQSFIFKMDNVHLVWDQYVPEESKHLITPEIREIVTRAIRNASFSRPRSIFKQYEPTKEETHCHGCGDKIDEGGYRLMNNSPLYCNRLCWEDNH